MVSSNLKVCSNYRQKERKRGKHLLLHGDISNQRDSIENSRAYGGVHQSFKLARED